MTTNPTISVVMPVYNEPFAYLEKSILSILNQTFRDLELIIVNDNPLRLELSDYLQNYSAKDKRVVLVDNPTNLGLTKSLNIGLKRAIGKYVARLDADDISLPNRLEVQYGFMKTNPQFYLIGSGTYNIDRDGNIIHNRAAIIEEGELKKAILKRNSICHSTVFFKNEGRIFYRDKFVYAQDYDFFLRLLNEDKRIVNIPQKLVKYRINPQAISYSNKAKQKLFAIKALEFYFQNVKNGTDQYSEFDPDSILSINIETSTDPVVLQEQIRNNFLFSNYKESRYYCIKYFRNYGLMNNMMAYFILSFCGTNIINFIRKFNLLDQMSNKQLNRTS